MNVTISSGKYNVISSGCVVADSWESDIYFHVQINTSLTLEIVLHFEEIEGKGRDFTVEAKEKALYFKCINFSDTVGTASPLELGEFLGTTLFFYFRNYEEKGVMRKIDYAFYTYEQEKK